MIVCRDMESLAEEAASRILEIGNRSIEERDIFTFVLAGGSTPRSVYKRLSKDRRRLDWSKVHIFWGDERCLPPDDPQSNYHMAGETLLERSPIPGGNVHRIRCELGLDQAAEAYQQQIFGFFNQHPALFWQASAASFIPSFDLILLGMGEDGHTVSLFPGSSALEETSRWVIGVQHDQPPPPLVDRVTFTLPLINAASHVIFLVSGESKAQRMAQALRGETEPSLPAQRVCPASGRLLWLVERSAATGLMINRPE